MPRMHIAGFHALAFAGLVFLSGCANGVTFLVRAPAEAEPVIRASAHVPAVYETTDDADSNRKVVPIADEQPGLLQRIGNAFRIKSDEPASDPFLDQGIPEPRVIAVPVEPAPIPKQTRPKPSPVRPVIANRLPAFGNPIKAVENALPFPALDPIPNRQPQPDNTPATIELPSTGHPLAEAKPKAPPVMRRPLGHPLRGLGRPIAHPLQIDAKKPPTTSKPVADATIPGDPASTHPLTAPPRKKVHPLKTTAPKPIAKRSIAREPVAKSADNLPPTPLALPQPIRTRKQRFDYLRLTKPAQIGSPIPTVEERPLAKSREIPHSQPLSRRERRARSTARIGGMIVDTASLSPARTEEKKKKEATVPAVFRAIPASRILPGPPRAIPMPVIHRVPRLLPLPRTPLRKPVVAKRPPLRPHPVMQLASQARMIEPATEPVESYAANRFSPIEADNSVAQLPPAAIPPSSLPASQATASIPWTLFVLLGCVVILAICLVVSVWKPARRSRR